MYCMKCGKEIDDTRVFCDNCLSVMSLHPVKQGTPVHLPSTATAAEKKSAPKKRQPTPEEQLARFQLATRWLSIALVSTLLILGIAITLLVDSINAPAANDIGKNYNTVSTMGKSG